MKVQALILLLATSSSVAQSTFQNLDFESANIQPGTPPGTVLPASDALPGWNCYVGVNQVTGVVYDAFASTLVTIHDANSPYVGVLQGNYSVALVIPAGSTFGAIAQLGTIPSGARSLQFYEKFGITVLFGGQQLPLVTLATTPTYNVLGADVTAFAGQTGELRFTGGGVLDNIAFSSQAIPEPSVLALYALATSLASRLCCRILFPVH